MSFSKDNAFLSYCMFHGVVSSGNRIGVLDTFIQAEHVGNKDIKVFKY